MIIPVAAGKHPLGDTAAYARRITRYKVRKGDTVQTVAENFGLPAPLVRRWNGLHGDSLQGRKVLALHLPVSPGSEVASAPHKAASRSRKPTETVANLPAHKAVDSEDEDRSEATNVLHHTVKSGETLYSIATAYKTTVDALKRTNGNVATLRPGMILIVQPSQ